MNSNGAKNNSKMCMVTVCLCVCAPLSPSVSQSIQAINEAVDAGDPAQTLAALRNPGAGLYGVTSECAQTYQTDLARIKEEKKAEGERQESHEWPAGCHGCAAAVSECVCVCVCLPR